MSERAKRIEEALGAFCPRCLRGDHSAHGSKITPNGCLWCRCGHLADCGCGGCEDLRAALAAAPDAPDATPAREEPCACGKVTLAFFTGTHSQLTKEGEQFISTNHRRDRCDREVVPVDAPDATGAPLVRCKRCGGSGRMGNPHIIDGWPVRCSECKGTGSAPAAAHADEEAP